MQVYLCKTFGRSVSGFSFLFYWADGFVGIKQLCITMMQNPLGEVILLSNSELSV